jgi:DNA-binding response OmpR family regulator
MELKDATLLIVEDEPTLREIMGAWFGRVSARVITAGNGAEAFKAVAENHVDLVITDVRMPILDGVGFLKKLHALQKTRPSVFFVTGFSDLDPREAYELGAEAILEKPVDRDDLLAVARHCLMSRRELWKTPVSAKPGEPAVQLASSGLMAELTEKRLACGRGGFNLKLEQPLDEGQVGLLAEFRDEQGELQAQGIVRWVSPDDQVAGFELLYVGAQHRSKMAELAERTDVIAFIPEPPLAESKPAAI